MPKVEQLPNDRFRRGETVRGIIKNVEISSRGPEIIISRSDDLFLKRLFEKEIPEIEVLRRVVLGDVFFPYFGSRKTLVDPGHELRHQAASCESRPIRIRLSVTNECGGTSRLVGAGTFLNTRPARSKREP